MTDSVLPQSSVAVLGLAFFGLPMFTVIPMIGFGFLANLITYNYSQNDIMWLWLGSLVSFLLALISFFWPTKLQLLRYVVVLSHLLGIAALLRLLQIITGDDRTWAIAGSVSSLGVYCVSIYSIWRIRMNQVTQND